MLMTMDASATQKTLETERLEVVFLQEAQFETFELDSQETLEFEAAMYQQTYEHQLTQINRHEIEEEIP